MDACKRIREVDLCSFCAILCGFCNIVLFDGFLCNWNVSSCFYMSTAVYCSHDLFKKIQYSTVFSIWIVCVSNSNSPFLCIRCLQYLFRFSWYTGDIISHPLFTCGTSAQRQILTAIYLPYWIVLVWKIFKKLSICNYLWAPRRRRACCRDSCVCSSISHAWGSL